MQKVPFVSFIVPTFNAEKHLGKCLQSIKIQDSPGIEFEVIVVDGRSTDKTIDIAKKFPVTILDNPKRDCDFAKSIGLHRAQGEIIALLDADNEIVQNDWLDKMVQPLVKNPELFGVESNYLIKKDDPLINQYCMAMHIGDPFARALAPKLEGKKRDGYLEYTIDPNDPYPLGANGFLWRRSVIDKVGFWQETFEESNFGAHAFKAGFVKFARVPGYGIYHFHVQTLGDFLRKRIKIGNKFMNREIESKESWVSSGTKRRFLKALVYCLTFIGPAIETLKKYHQSRLKAWLWHPIACFLSVLVYGFVFLKRKLSPAPKYPSW